MHCVVFFGDVFLCLYLHRIRLFIDQEALKASHSSASEKATKTRQSTLSDFNIDLDTMTSLDGGANDTAAAARRVNQCKPYS